MYELCNVKNNTYYINCPAKIGLYVDGTDVYLIDSGNDKDAGKKVKRILDENGWTLKCIINTHSHADHIGGNKYLQQQTGCDIYAKGIEKSFTLFPILEPAFLGGSYPSKDLLHKFLYAQESCCKSIEDCCLPKGFEIVELPGHSFEMIGVKTPDGVLFVADSVSSPSTIDKYGISFLYDVKKYLETLDFLGNYSADYFVPSHAEIVCNMDELVNINRDKVFEISNVIKTHLREEKTFEDLLSQLFDKYNLIMTNEQYVLIGSTVKSYLSYLKDEGEIESFFLNNRMYWKTV
ncbi:MAG: MBL fold metallo-hydrolase [Ruminococcaceae bacterium]|nr:MBL fold metallo-hydrolase [Oscillospiraceae bacterium]